MKTIYIMAYNTKNSGPETEVFHTPEKAVKWLSEGCAEEGFRKANPDEDPQEYLGEYYDWVREENDNMCNFDVDLTIEKQKPTINPHDTALAASVISYHFFDKIMNKFHTGLINTYDKIAELAVDFEKIYGHVEDWAEFCDEPTKPFQDWEDCIVVFVKNKLKL